MPRRSPSRLLVLASGLLGAAVLGAAAGPAAAEDPLRYAEDQAPGIVNPLFTSTMSEARLGELVFEGLYTDDRDLRTTPDLAESARLSADRTELTITLRRGVTWHDGTPFSARDVVFTIEAMKDQGTASTEAGRVAWIDSAEAVDDHTVLLRFGRPEASPEDKLFFKILPAHRFEGTTVRRTDPFRNKPVGTGPFQLERYNDDGSISLTRYAQHRDPAGLSEVVLREVSDKNYQAKLLMYESLEALVRVLPRDLAMLDKDRGVELYPYQTNSWWYLGFNLRGGPWTDPRLRQAVALLVDPEALLAPIGTGDTVTGPFVPSSPFYNHQVAPWGVDASRAGQLLQEAGYTKGDDGWSRAGRPLTMRITAPKGLESAQEVVINLQSQLQRQGIDVDVDFLDEASWRRTVWREKQFDVVLSQWSFDRNEDVREQFHSQGSRNFGGYSSTDVDALLDRAREAADPQEKKAALRELHAKVHEDAPMVFLWTLDSYSAMRTKVRDVVVHPFYFFTWADDWTME